MFLALLNSFDTLSLKPSLVRPQGNLRRVVASSSINCDFEIMILVMKGDLRASLQKAKAGSEVVTAWHRPWAESWAWHLNCMAQTPPI